LRKYKYTAFNWRKDKCTEVEKVQREKSTGGGTNVQQSSGGGTYVQQSTGGSTVYSRYAIFYWRRYR
jgi:hypothetical protein